MTKDDIAMEKLLSEHCRPGPRTVLSSEVESWSSGAQFLQLKEDLLAPQQTSCIKRVEFQRIGGQIVLRIAYSVMAR